MVACVVAAAGCDTWKRADGQVGRTLAMHVNTETVGDRELIVIRSRRSAVLIDQVGGRVVDFHLGRRPRFVVEVDPQSPDGQRWRQDKVPSRPNVLREPGWRAVCDRCDPALDRTTYWQTDATTNRVVLLSDSVGGLRWRKTFYVDEYSGELFIDASLQNTSLHPVTVNVSSLVAARGELKTHGDTQRAWADDQWLSRRLIEGPPLQPRPPENGGVQGFDFVEQTIPAGGSLSWKEHWWITTDATGTRPSEPARPRKDLSKGGPSGTGAP